MAFQPKADDPGSPMRERDDGKHHKDKHEHTLIPDPNGSSLPQRD
jgi:hypothetical protein